MNKVIIINGYNETGKDEFIKQFNSFFINTFNYSTIRYYKKMAIEYFNWNPEKKDEKSRLLLSNLKKLHKEYDDSPFERACEYIDQISRCANDWVVFIHSREPEEIKRLKKRYNAFTLLVDRDSAIPANNSSDMSVKMMNYDYTVDNNGTKEDLKKQAKIFYDRISYQESLGAEFEKVLSDNLLNLYQE